MAVSNITKVARATASNVRILEIIREAISEEGIRGLYEGYVTTLSRNMPSSMLRFAFYEEMKHVLGVQNFNDKVFSFPLILHYCRSWPTSRCVFPPSSCTSILLLE